MVTPVQSASFVCVSGKAGTPAAQRTLPDPRGWPLGTGDKSWSLFLLGKCTQTEFSACTPTYIPVHMHICTHPHAHITHTHPCMHICTCTCTHLYTCMHAETCHAHMHAHACMCAHLCMYIYMHIALSGTKGPLGADISAQMTCHAVRAVFLPPAW